MLLAGCREEPTHAITQSERVLVSECFSSIVWQIVSKYDEMKSRNIMEVLINL